jgi:hypothetical protein
MTLDLFGCKPGAPRARLDGDGLLLLLRGCEILATTTLDRHASYILSACHQQ